MFGHIAGLDSRSSFIIAMSCNHGHRLIEPLTNPSVCTISCWPLFRKSAIFTSQHHPVHATPYCCASCVNGAYPRPRSLAISASDLAWLMNKKFDSSRPHAVVMLETIASNRPLSLMSAQSTPMPLNDPLPITNDFGVVGVRFPNTVSNLIVLPSDTLCSTNA